MAKRKKVTIMTSRKRLVFFFGVILVMFVVLAFRLGHIQIIDADEYSSKALRQQTRDVPITAKRGNIYDTNKKPLAINQSMNTIWVRPAEVKNQEKKQEGFTEEMAASIAEILGDMTKDEVYEIITSDTSLLRIKKYVDEDVYKRQGILYRHFLGYIRYPHSDRYGTVPGRRSDAGNRYLRMLRGRRLRRPLLTDLRYDDHGVYRRSVQSHQSRIHSAAVCAYCIGGILRRLYHRGSDEVSMDFPADYSGDHGRCTDRNPFGRKEKRLYGIGFERGVTRKRSVTI